MTRTCCWALAGVLAVAADAAAQSTGCLSAAGKRIMNKPLEISLTDAGRTALKEAQRPYAFVHVTRVASSGPPAEYIQMIDGGSVSFTLSHQGQYRLSLYGAEQPTGWPSFDQTGERIASCRDETVAIEKNTEPDFPGFRAQAWVAYRPATRAELGTSAYYGRLGLGVAVVGSPARSNEPNQVTATGDLRWRGARGYLGGGLEFFPHAEPERHQWRPRIVSGEELPTYKGKPLWFLLDLRLDDPQIKPWRALTLSFGIRMDLTNGEQP